MAKNILGDQDGVYDLLQVLKSCAISFILFNTSPFVQFGF